METTIRPYSAEDFETCVRIFKSNVPNYFDESELSDFEEYLKIYAHNSFWSVVANDRLVACGGIHTRQNGVGTLCYGMVDSSLHKQGIGTKLAHFRLAKLLDLPEIDNIALDTSQYTYGFYEHLGFKVTKIQKHFYGPNLDCYSMELNLPQNSAEVEKIKAAVKKDLLPPAP